MSLSLIWPAGLAFGEILASDDMERLDASQAKAVDGVGGGTYAPSSKIVINGAGLQTNSLTVTGTLSLLGNTTIGNASIDALSVLATSTFSSPVTLNDQLVVNADQQLYGGLFIHSVGALVASCDVTLGDNDTRTITVNGTATFNAPITANDTVELWSDFTVHSAGTSLLKGNVTLGDDTSKTLSIGAALNTLLNLTDAGRVPLSWGGLTPATGHTFHAGDGQIFNATPSNSGPITYSLSASGAVPGDVMIFYTGFSWPGATVTIQNTSGQEQRLLTHNQPNQVVIYVFDGSLWRFALGINV